MTLRGMAEQMTPNLLKASGWPILWGGRIVAVLAALFVIAVILPNVMPGRAAWVVRVAWTGIPLAAVALVFVGNGRRRPWGWLGWTILVILVIGVLAGAI